MTSLYYRVFLFLGLFVFESFVLASHTESQGENLFSVNLKGKAHLDLRGRNLKDEDIYLLAFNDTTGSLINIDLSDNPDLTWKSIDYISDSSYIGSVRAEPQIGSGSYAVPFSTVYVRVGDTKIKREEVKKYETDAGAKKHFRIKYPSFSESVDYAIKLVVCNFF